MNRLSRAASETEVAPAQLALRAVAGHGLGTMLELPHEPVHDDVFFELLALANHHRLTGTVAELARQGTLPASDYQYETLIAHHTDWMRRALDIERVLLRVEESFTRAAIDVRVLKGVALAHLVYDDPSWRVFGDLDVLVPADRFDDAVRLLQTELDGDQAVPEVRPGFDHEFGKEALVRVDGVEVDLHRTFVAGPFGLTIELDELFRGGAPFVVGTRSMTGLDVVASFLHAAYNVALGDYPVRLGSLRDLLMIHDRLRPDLARVTSMSARWRSTAVVHLAARLAVDTLALPAGHDLAGLARGSAPRREQWLLRSYLTTARSYTRPLASLAVIGGVRPRVRYARALLAPSAEYLRSRNWSERSHLRAARDRLFDRG